MLVSSNKEEAAPDSYRSNDSSNAIPGVISLNARNFDSSISDGSKWLIEFYSPWCGHCKRFAPTYESVAMTLHNDPKTNIKVGKIDGSSDLVLASRFAVRGFPSFYLIDGWDVYQFKDARSKEKLIQFATRASEEYEPISLMSSPLGPFGRFRGLLMHIGMNILDIYEYLTKTKSFAPAVACLLMSSIGIMAGVLLILGIGMFLVSSKPKTD